MTIKYLNVSQKIIGVVYDVPKQLDNSEFFTLPHDAISEWESKETIDILCKTWNEIGFKVILFPLDKNFLTRWANESQQCDVIHSIVEGFGSLARESWVLSLCELSGIPYIGSNPFVHSLCMSKNHTKIVCDVLKIPTAQSYIIYNVNDIENINDDFFKVKHFIKPNGEGSGMGVDSKHSISWNKQKTIKTVSQLLNLYPDGVLLEKYLPGAEYTTGIIGSNKQFLPIAHIEVPDGVYGAANKTKDYLCEKVTFPNLDAHMQYNLKHYSENLFSYFKMLDFVRFDWKCDENGDVYFLEANTLPGLSNIYGVLPLMAKEAGIEYGNFLQILFDGAYARRNDKNLWYGQNRIRKPTHCLK